MSDDDAAQALAALTRLEETMKRIEDDLETLLTLAKQIAQGMGMRIDD